MIFVIIHSILLILLGSVLVICNIKPDSISFWVIICIVISLLISYDRMMSCGSENSEEEDTKENDK